MAKRSASKKEKTDHQPPAPAASRPRVQWLWLALIAALSILVYVNSLTGEFIGDDHVQIERNENIRSLGNIPRDFTTSVWAFAAPNGTSNDRYYRPLQNVIYTLTYVFGGLSPVPFHVVSVALHTGTTIMVYLLLLELGFGSASLFAAALFAVHPVHTEAVAWAAGVGDVACGLFYCAALWTLLCYVNRRGVLWLVLSVLCLVLALFSKEMAITFPAAAALLLAMKANELGLNYRKAGAVLAPHLIALVLWAALRTSVVGFGVPTDFLDHPTMFDWLTLAVWMLGRYLRFAFLPYPLAAFALTPLYLSYRVASTCLYAIAIAAPALLLWLYRSRLRNGLLWYLMFAAMMAPVFYFKGISGGNFFAERYLYIPTLPAVALLAVIWQKLKAKAAIIAAAGLLLAFSIATVARNRDWQNDERLYLSSLAFYPDAGYTCLNLGAVYLDSGKYSEAEKCLEVAQRYFENPAFSHPGTERYRLEMELGTLAARRGISGDAESHLRQAIAINPNAADAYIILGGVLVNLNKDFSAAIPILERAIYLGPSDDQARDSMGVALYNLKRFAEAERYFREALRINPSSERSQQHLSAALKRIEGRGKTGTDPN